METNLSDSARHIKDRRPSIKRLNGNVCREIASHLEAEGRSHLRLDEMFVLFKSVIQHVAPDKQKMIWPFRSFDSKD